MVIIISPSFLIGNFIVAFLAGGVEWVKKVVLERWGGEALVKGCFVDIQCGSVKFYMDKRCNLIECQHNMKRNFSNGKIKLRSFVKSKKARLKCNWHEEYTCSAKEMGLNNFQMFERNGLK